MPNNLTIQEIEAIIANTMESVKTCDKSIVPTITELSRASQEAYNHKEMDPSIFSNIIERIFNINDEFFEGCMCNKKPR